jgi:hypothetical protein
MVAAISGAGNRNSNGRINAIPCQTKGFLGDNCRQTVPPPKQADRICTSGKPKKADQEIDIMKL